MWLPFWLTSVKPAASNFLFISRYARGLSGTYFNLDTSYLRRNRGDRRLEMKLQGFLQVFKRFLFRLALAGDVNFKALRYEPFALLPHTCREPLFHSSYLH